MRKRRLNSIHSEEIYLCVGCDQHEFARYIRKTYPKYKYENGKGADGHMEDPVDDDGIKFFYLWIDEKNDKNAKRFAIMHECEHLVFALFNHVGIPTNVECDEAFTYQSGDFVRQVFKYYNL